MSDGLVTNYRWTVDGFNEPRRENQLICYSGENTIERNDYGYEVAVDRHGIVIDKNTRVEIPNGGFVLSGHGESHVFLRDTVQLGMKVKWMGQQVIIEDHLFKRTEYLLKVKMDEARKWMNEAKNELLDVPVENAEAIYEILKEKINSIQQYKNQVNPDDEESIRRYNEQVEDIETGIMDIFYITTISRPIEARGVWHRPLEKSLEEIQQLLDEIKALNFNELYIETLWNGYAIYPSSVFPYQPLVDGQFGEYGNDYLKALLGEAKKRNISVHAWVENFFVGHIDHHSSIWDDHPEWRIRNYDGSEIQSGKVGGEEEGFLFLDPANPEVQNFILAFYRELVSNYDLMGLQLDYIRYPAGNIQIEHSSGYTSIAKEQFLQEYQLEPSIFEPEQFPNYYSMWCDWRQKQITGFVKRVYEEIVPLKERLLLSIAVGPQADYAKKNLMQDWKTWVTNGWIDIVLPMAYVRSVDQITMIVTEMNAITNKRTYNYTGVSPTYDRLPREYNTYFIDASRKANALGSAIFAFHSLKGNELVKQTLLNSVYRVPAIRPHDELPKVLYRGYGWMLERMNRIDIPKGFITVQQKEFILEQFEQLIAISNESEDDFNTIENEFMQLIDMVNGSVKYPSNKRLIEQLEQLLLTVQIKKNRYHMRVM